MVVLARVAGIGLALVSLIALVGCESTIDRAKQLTRNGSRVFHEQGLIVRRANPDIDVVSRSVVEDSNGIAMATELRNRTGRMLLNVPVAINVLGPHGQSIFRNNSAGLDPSLTTLTVLPAHTTALWVNDQVLGSGPVGGVKVVPGAAKPATGPVPQLKVLEPSIFIDPTSGPYAKGTVINTSKVFQYKLIVFAVSRKHGRVVAAGRAGVPKLGPGKKALYRVYFIGDPRGGQITVSAPPSTL
jgi:hypothetical protein